MSVGLDTFMKHVTLPCQLLTFLNLRPTLYGFGVCFSFFFGKLPSLPTLCLKQASPSPLSTPLTPTLLNAKCDGRDYYKKLTTDVAQSGELGLFCWAPPPPHANGFMLHPQLLRFDVKLLR